jgi:PleD family two-component response regulator
MRRYRCACRKGRAVSETAETPDVAPIRILLVEDNVAHARFIRALLVHGDAPVELHQAGRLDAGCRRAATETFDVILADLYLPDGQGRHVIERLMAAGPRVPIVVITALDDENVAGDLMTTGAQDMLVKDGLSTDLLLHAIRRARQRAAGLDASSARVLIDSATGLYNRRGLVLAAERCLAFARREKHPVALICLTIENATPEEFEQFSRLVAETVRDADLVGRVGRNRLGVALPDDKSDPPRVLMRIEARKLASPLAGLTVVPDVVRFTDDQRPFDELLAVFGDEEEPPVTEQRGRVLVVSPDPNLGEAVGMALGRAWDVSVAVNNGQLVRVAALDEPHIAIIDLAMTDPGGTALARTIREQPETAMIPVLAVGTAGEVGDGSQARVAGYAAMLDRNRLVSDLAPAVAHALRSR